MRIIRMEGILSGIALLLFSAVLFIIGLILTISIIFAFAGIPMMIVAALLALASIFIVVGGIISLLAPWKRNNEDHAGTEEKKLSVHETIKKRKGQKVVDVREKGGVFR